MVSIYSVTHFLVDFACAFFMFRFIAGTPGSYLGVLLYNFCAFAMQMPIGLIADRLNRNYLFAICGCLLIVGAYGLFAVPLLAVIVIGIGNALFHLGGGIDVLNISEKKLSALGIFVSPGAFGVFFGTMLGRGGSFSALFFPLSLIVAAGLILVLYRSQKGAYPKNAPFSLDGINLQRVFIAIGCLFLVVCLRSFVGLALSFPWKGVGYWGIVLVCAVVFGKVLGGFAADRFGLVRTAAISLGVAAVLFLLPTVPAAGVVAVLLFNMTMPITLWVLARLIPGAKGFAFGILTFGLFLGFLPVFLGVQVSSGVFWVFTLLAGFSLVLLLVGIRKSGFWKP